MTEQKPSTLGTISGLVGVALYLIVGYIYLVSGLSVPVPWLMVLWVVWIGGLFALVRVWQRRRPWTPAVGVAALAFWALYVSAGAAIFDWTA